MTRVAVGVSFVVALITGPVFGQSTEPTRTFDAADVHVRPRSTNPTPFMTGGVLRGGRYDLRNATMLDLIRTAYGATDDDTILGGPNWLERDRFDIVAKAPQTTSPETVRLMLQALLADRFKLVLHQDTRPMPGFALTLGKGKPKLKEASGQGAGCQGQPQSPDPGAIPYAVVACRNMTMAAFAQNLRNMAGAYLTGPVADLTGLSGSWDFDLKWTARALLSRAGADGISVFDAVDQQLGLKLELQKVATPVLVVDTVNQKPTDNPADVVQSLPTPPPAEFDVAEIKLSAPDTRQNIRIQPGGRLDAQGVTMKMMITLAWDINDDELLAGAPKWLDSTRYTLTAKASNAIAGTAAAPQVDIDDLRLMLRALLIERFKIKSHSEDRPVTAYTLLAAKPKLTKADPGNRTGWKEGPAPDAKDQRNATLARMVTARNMTMAQFAEDLQRMAPGYIHSPVVDATGVDGAYDFTLTFTPIGLLMGGPGGAGGRGGEPAAQGGAAAPAAADPSGGLSLFDAVSKQLGLKLEARKRTMAVLVLDHIEEKPSED